MAKPEEKREGFSRVEDYNAINPFAEIVEETKRVEDILGVELVLEDRRDIQYDTDDGEIWGLAVLYHEDGSDKQEVFITFSEVLRSRLLRVPQDNFPVNGAITQEGKGQRKYYTIR